MNGRPDVPERGAPLPKWQAGSLRVTAFCIDAPDLNSVHWWEELTKQPAEVRNITRAGLGQLVEQGTLGNRTLHLQVQLGRVDWLIIPKDDPESDVFPLLGDFEESASYLRELILQWLAVAPPLSRLAFGSQMYLPVANQKEAMKVIATMLPSVNIKWEGIKDFILQANRPRPFVTLPDLGEINRITKWQAVVRKKIVGVIVPEGQAPLATKEETSAFLELDINTPPPTDLKSALPSERLPDLLGELVQNAEGVLKGDVL
jgi:hypothetical protein